MLRKNISLIVIIIVSFLWGTAGIAKPLVRAMDPFTVGLLRFFVASLVILPFFLTKQKKPLGHLLPIIPLGLLSAANVALYYVGLQTSTANAAAIIYAATPLVVALMSHILTNEKLTTIKLIGIFIGISGSLFIGLLPFLKKEQTITGDLFGNSLFIAAIFVWAIYTIGSRHAIVTKKYSSLAVATVSILTSAAVFAVFSSLTWKSTYISLLASVQNLFFVSYLAIPVTVITFLLYQWIIHNTSFNFTVVTWI